MDTDIGLWCCYVLRAGVLKLVGGVNPPGNDLSNLEGHIAFSYYLGIFAFVVLGPYIWNTLEMLKLLEKYMNLQKIRTNINPPCAEVLHIPIRNRLNLL